MLAFYDKKNEEAGMYDAEYTPLGGSQLERRGNSFLPQVKLKSNLVHTGSNTQLGFNLTHRSSRSSFHNLKQNMMDRIISKASLHDHLKHTLGVPGGNAAGTY